MFLGSVKTAFNLKTLQQPFFSNQIKVHYTVYQVFFRSIVLNPTCAMRDIYSVIVSVISPLSIVPKLLKKSQHF